MNGREPDVSCRHSVLTFFLEVRKKRQDSGWVQILQVKFRHGPLAAHGEKAQKQYNRVTVAVDGVWACSANTWQVFVEDIAHYGAEQVGKFPLHRCPPFRLGTGTTSSP